LTGTGIRSSNHIAGSRQSSSGNRA
jgi:hypothetical protein